MKKATLGKVQARLEEYVAFSVKHPVLILRDGEPVAMLVGLDRPTAAEFSFFLAMPTMAAAFAHSLMELRHQISADRTIELVIGFVMAFFASLMVVKPFMAVVRRRGFAPFAWYRIVAGVMLLVGVATGWLR